MAVAVRTPPNYIAIPSGGFDGRTTRSVDRNVADARTCFGSFRIRRSCCRHQTRRRLHRRPAARWQARTMDRDRAARRPARARGSRVHRGQLRPHSGQDRSASVSLADPVRRGADCDSVHQRHARRQPGPGGVPKRSPHRHVDGAGGHRTVGRDPRGRQRHVSGLRRGRPCVRQRGAEPVDRL